MSAQSAGDYVVFAEGLARKAGRIMLEHFENGGYLSWKKDISVVTEADIAINRLVIEEISKTYPDHGISGEEESMCSDYCEFVWVCDPIDGTAMFARGLEMSTFSLALVKDGRPIVGIIYDPFHEKLYSAVDGGGAFLNKKPIHVSDASSLEKTVMIAEGSKIINVDDFDVTIRAIPGLRLVKFNSIIFGGKQVASGHFSAMVFSHTKHWDVAALKVIIEEAGGKTSDLFGNDQRYDAEINGFVASNGLVHGELLEVIRKCRK